MKGQEPIESLVYEFSRLPGIGRKSAERLTYYLLDEDEERVEALAQALIRAKTETKKCSSCYNYTDQDPCPICSNPHRDRTKICVVEQPKDVFVIEKTRKYHGLYHVLHGVVAPQKGLGVKDITIPELLIRLGEEDVEEVILATNPNQDGQTTALYLAQLIQPMGIRCTRISYGLPFGGGMEYYDSLTVGTAIENRVEIQGKTPEE